ncbi:putative aldouronate transport system permease protein [Paenibacillus sp. yr247]|uniref:carbohydrate ABC transporter permease n=1 Tax=Paenibacillus sp. yr247 TaxID=1761880 RepID=UPI00087F79DA|nr:carbohydrate ABC transporter permease [Paenibacillus sp. yr247]SDO19388.1 putative aldouronate transport system permease protein [Paenibacillus sp. yr247]
MVGAKRWDLFTIVNYSLLTLFCLLTLYPIIYVIAGSFNDGNDYMRGGVYFFPRQFSLASYMIVFRDDRLISSIIVSLLRTGIGTITSILFTAMVAYAMSRKYLIGRNGYYWIHLITLFFNGGLIPYFILLKYLNLLDSFWVFIIPSVFSVFNMIIFQGFFREIPEDIHESATMDGAGDFRIFWALFIPLSTPILATVGLWNAVWHWNSFFDAMLFTNSQKLMPLQLYLMKLIKEADVLTASSPFVPPQIKKQFSVQTVRMAAIMISTLPILGLYPFMQRYFVTGIMVGSLKG